MKKRKDTKNYNSNTTNLNIVRSWFNRSDRELFC